MNKSWLYLGLVGSLAIGITSCGDGGKPAATPSASPSAAASPVAVAPAASPTPIGSPTPATTATTTTANPTTSPKPLSVDVAAGLIPPTDADNWTKTVSKGRNNPFAVLSLRATEVVDRTDPLIQIATAPSGKIAKTGSNTVKSGSNKSLPGIKVGTEIAAINPTEVKPTSGSKKPPVGGKPTAGVRSGTGKTEISQIPRTGIDRPLPKISVAIKPKTELPSATTTRKPNIAINPIFTPPRRDPKIAIKPLPQPYRPNLNPGSGSFPGPGPGSSNNRMPIPMEPTLAQSIGISGTIEVGGKTQVILKLPNESFSRYVEVGDRVYEGKVKVKRVEGEQTLSPIVILEEAGIEVPRKVGDLAGTPVKAASNQEAPQPKLP